MNTLRWRRASLGAMVVAGSLVQAAAQSSIFNIVASPSPTSGGNTLNAVTALAADDAWAVGFDNDNQLNGARTLTEHFDGTKWTVVASPNPGSTPACQGQNTGNVLNAVAAVSSTSLWAVGFSFTCNADLKPMVLHYNGTKWSVVQTPALLNNNAALNGVVALAANNIYAVGYQPAPNGAVLPLIEHFDGHAWSVVAAPSGNPTGLLSAVAANGPNDIWAVGNKTAPNTPVETFAVHFDGTAWSVVPTPNPVGGSSLAQNVLLSVNAMGINDVTAVGFILDFANQRELTLVEHWDGMKWSVIPSPNVSNASGSLNTLNGVTGASANDLYAAGSFSDAATAGQPETLVEHFDGTSWSIVASPVRGLAQHLNGVFALPNSGDVWAVGAAARNGADPETGLLQLPKTLVLFTPIG